MLDVDKLVGAIYSRGFTKGSFSRAMKKNPCWFSAILKKKNVSIAEADAITVVLKLSSEEAMSIFFAQFVA